MTNIFTLCDSHITRGDSISGVLSQTEILKQYLHAYRIFRCACGRTITCMCIFYGNTYPINTRNSIFRSFYDSNATQARFVIIILFACVLLEQIIMVYPINYYCRVGSEATQILQRRRRFSNFLAYIGSRVL